MLIAYIAAKPQKITSAKKSYFLEEHTISSFQSLAEQFVQKEEFKDTACINYLTTDNIFGSYLQVVECHLMDSKIKNPLKKIKNPLAQMLNRLTEASLLYSFREIMAKTISKWKHILEVGQPLIPKLRCRICEKEYSADIMVRHTEQCLQKSELREELKKIDEGLLNFGEEVTEAITGCTRHFRQTGNTIKSRKNDPFYLKSKPTSKSVFQRFVSNEQSSTVRKLPVPECPTKMRVQKSEYINFELFPKVEITAQKSEPPILERISDRKRNYQKQKSSIAQGLLSCIPESVKKKRAEIVKKASPLLVSRERDGPRINIFGIDSEKNKNLPKEPSKVNYPFMRSRQKLDQLRELVKNKESINKKLKICLDDTALRPPEKSFEIMRSNYTPCARKDSLLQENSGKKVIEIDSFPAPETSPPIPIPKPSSSIPIAEPATSLQIPKPVTPIQLPEFLTSTPIPETVAPIPLPEFLASLPIPAPAASISNFSSAEIQELFSIPSEEGKLPEWTNLKITQQQSEFVQKSSDHTKFKGRLSKAREIKDSLKDYLKKEGKGHAIIEKEQIEALHKLRTICRSAYSVDHVHARSKSSFCHERVNEFSYRISDHLKFWKNGKVVCFSDISYENIIINQTARRSLFLEICKNTL